MQPTIHTYMYMCIITYTCTLLLTDSNFSWKGGREHDCLSIPHWRHAALLNDSPDLRLKSHVQHPVSLIQNHISTVEVREYKCVYIE